MTDPDSAGAASDRAEHALAAVRAEVARARAKFSSPEGLMTALSEEHGELAKALLDEPWERVVAEAVQVACVALRIATEGDPTLAEHRARKGPQPGPR